MVCNGCLLLSILRCRASAESLPMVQSALWIAASRLAGQAASCSAAEVDPELAAGPGGTQAVFAAWQRAHSLLGEVSTAWQWCHSSSGGAACEPHVDPRKELQQLSKVAVADLSMLQMKLLDPETLDLIPLYSSAALEGVFNLALQVQASRQHSTVQQTLRSVQNLALLALFALHLRARCCQLCGQLLLRLVPCALLGPTTS